jgi:transposase
VIIATDLARTKWVTAVQWNGQTHRTVATPGELRHLQQLVAHYHPRCAVEVVYEACGFGYEIAWWAQAQGLAVLVVAPSRVSRVPGARVKTDRRDARELAQQYAHGQLKGIAIPTRAQHEWRQVSRTYEQALSDRQRAQKRLRMLLQEHGRIGPAAAQGWAVYERWLSAQTLPAPVAQCVGELQQLRAGAAQAVGRLRTALGAVAQRAEYRSLVAALAQQSGVGRFTSLRFVLEIGDIHRFPTADSIANYVGLAPSEHSSGTTVRRGHVQRCGPGALRGWLIQCAWACVRAGHDRSLCALFTRVAARAPGQRKCAAVAVARKLAVRLRARWLEWEAAPAPPA